MEAEFIYGRNNQDELPQCVGAVQHLFLQRFDATVRLLRGLAAVRSPCDLSFRISC